MCSKASRREEAGHRDKARSSEVPAAGWHPIRLGPNHLGSSPPAVVIRVLLVADVRLHRDGVSALLREDGRVRVAATASPSDRVPRGGGLDVVVLDAATENRVELARRWAVDSRPVVAIGIPEEEKDLIALAEAGVLGFVEREATVDELVASVESAARGEASCPPRVATTLLRRLTFLTAPPAPSGSPALTARERQRGQAETLTDNVAEALNTADPVSMSEAELDTLFERLEPRGTGLEPYFEDFLGGLTRKLKTFARKAVDVAKKGLTLFPGVGLLLNKLKALLRPLFNKVVRAGIDQLPVALRPVARQLAQRVFGQGETEEEAQGEDLVGAPAAPDVSAIQQQLDLDMAALLFAEDTEQEAIVTEALTEAERSPDGAPVAELQEARARFVDELERGVDPQQALENFVPAVMAVLPIARTVIGTIGRGRVVNFLAGFLAKFISRYVPAEASNQLSQAIVDTGLRMVSLEAPSPAEVQQLAPDAVASAVEDTVRRVAELDETTLEHPALLEAAVTEAFHQAAAENFPPQVLIPELHEATVHGTWVAMPLGRRRKYYKKYTRVFDVQITPQIAASLKTSSGSTIAAFLKDQLGVTAPVHARVHVYQAMTGTTFARIARLETGVSGLGRATRRASALFHPLTVRAAGALLHEPKLGRDAAVTPGFPPTPPPGSGGGSSFTPSRSGAPARPPPSTAGAGASASAARARS